MNFEKGLNILDFDLEFWKGVQSSEPLLKVLSNGTGGGVWVVSIDRPIFRNISADLKKLFKGPRPFKNQKTIMSG